MLMTTGAIEDHVCIKEDLGFTEQPALVDPALNRGGEGWTRKYFTPQLFYDSVISSFTSSKGIQPAKPISFKSYTKLLNMFN